MAASRLVPRLHCLTNRLPLSPPSLISICYHCHQSVSIHCADDVHHDGGSNSSSSPPVEQSLAGSICSMVSESFWQQTSHASKSPPELVLGINPEDLSREQAITVVASLAEQEGSMVALSFFYWAIGFPKFRHFMRFYIVSATSVLGNKNFEVAHEVMRCMVRSFSEIGKLKESVNMVIEMRNQGLALSSRTMNYIIEIACQMGLFEYAEDVFDEMRVRDVCPDSTSYKLIALAYCRMGKMSVADRWLGDMVERGFIVDNATCTLMITAFCDEGLGNRAYWYFNKWIQMGLKPNLINFTALINGLCKRGSIKQAFETLEEMVQNGWKPNVYTHTVLIDGLCKKGWTEMAFRWFLKLVRSDNYKPNVHTYTSMINGYCQEHKLTRAEMLFSRMKEQGLVPNTNSYTCLINGHSKAGNFERAYELMDIMDSFTYGALISGLCKESKLDAARQLYDTMFDWGLSPSEVTRVTLAYEYFKQDDSATAIIIMERFEKKLWIRTATTLIRKLGSEKKVGIASLLFHKLLDKDTNVDRVTLAAFTTACYESNKYALVSDLSKRITR
ncbi:unnamed protein product [Linum tenue]|uniref:Pentatricopeptide repeat-containing protein n=1 Tax=Linum tenue TaxID=586396 RepID=A0AAV0RKN1_9ROSI|nr:unnamed protein product [Linum tenue]